MKWRPALSRYGLAPWVATTSLLGLGVLNRYQLSLSTFLDEHSSTTARIVQLRTADSEWSTQILKVQAGIAVSFDALTDASQSIARSRDVVVQEARALGIDTHALAFEKLDAALKAKAEGAERLKSEHAILTNSLRFLPTQLALVEAEVRSLPATADAQREAGRLSLDLSALNREVLRSISYADAASMDRVSLATQQLRLRVAAARSLDSMAASTELLAAHANAVAQHRYAEQLATTLAMAAPSNAAVDEIEAAVAERFRHRLGIAERVRVVAFGLALVAAAAALYASVGWVRSYRALRRANLSLAEQLERTRTWMRRTDMLKDVAVRDPLTGLINRRFVGERLERALSRADRARSGLAVVFLDLDGFKCVNDTHGHDIGDELLIEVARRLTRGVRETDTVARLGGDEFLIILEGQSRDGAALVAGKVLADLKAIESIRDHQVEVSASYGVASWEAGTSPRPDPKELLVHADREMYAAKRTGKGQAGQAKVAAGAT
jgi:diguanylate cyclase (GGDEF)-like protein